MPYMSKIGYALRFLRGFLFTTVFCVRPFAVAPTPLESSSEPVSLRELVSQMPLKDRDALTSYFAISLLHSEIGYVLYGVKPICLESFEEKPVLPQTNFVFPREDSLSRNSEAIYRGMEVWRSLPVSTANSPIVNCDHFDVNSKTREILWINREAFLDVVTQNLNLFKAILGPSVTGESLLNMLTSGQETLSSALNHNKILIGIALGFGVENSIFGSRLEAVDIALTQRERPPLARRQERCGGGMTQMPKLSKYFGLGKPLQDVELLPSYGFSSLWSERLYLQQNLISSLNMVDCESPRIPHFLCLRNDLASSALLAKYVSAHTKVKALLNSNALLQEALELILGSVPLAMKPPHSSTKLVQDLETLVADFKKEYRRKDLVSFVGNIIKNNLLCQSQEYLKNFIIGMQEAELENGRRGNWHENSLLREPILTLGKTLMQEITKNNLFETAKALDAVAQTSNSHEVVPGKLYFKIMQNGKGPTLTPDSSQVKLRYEIYYLAGRQNGEEVLSSSLSDLQFHELCPGFAHGILGMQENEVREVYMHSDYTYGNFANFEPGVGLMARVKLHSFSAPQGKPISKFPKLVPLDFDQKDIKQSIDSDDLQQKAAYAEGYFAWSFYRHCSDLYSLQELIDILNQNSISKKSPEKNERESCMDVFKILYKRAFTASVLTANHI